MLLAQIVLRIILSVIGLVRAVVDLWRWWNDSTPPSL